MAMSGNMAGFNHPNESCCSHSKGGDGGSSSARRPRLLRGAAAMSSTNTLPTIASARSLFSSSVSSSSIINECDGASKATASQKGTVSRGSSLARFSTRFVPSITVPSVRRRQKGQTRSQSAKKERSTVYSNLTRKTSTFNNDRKNSKVAIEITTTSLVGDEVDGSRKEEKGTSHLEWNDGLQQHAATDMEVELEENIRTSFNDSFKQRRTPTVSSDAKRFCSFIEKNRLFDDVSEEVDDYDGFAQIFVKAMLWFTIMLLLSFLPNMPIELLSSLGRGFLTLMMFAACLTFMVLIQLAFSLDDK